MTCRNLLAVVIMSAAGCTMDTIDLPGHDACIVAMPYSGPSLRAPLDAGAARLEPGHRSGLAAGETARLAQAVARARAATGAPSMTVAVWQAGGDPWSQSHGTPPGHLHYWASIGKIITAAAILRLEEEGRLSLDDPISDHVEGVPNGDIITLRMLLDHTSGLYSANEDPTVRDRGGPLDLAGVLEVVARQPPYACPGAAWRYSNSGYTLLGAVIEAVTGEPYHRAATELVLSRSAARSIRIAAPADALSDLVPPADAASDPRADIRSHQAAGGVVADAESMAVFLRDLLAGLIVPRRSVSQMVAELHPMFQDGMWYGLGLMVYDVPGADGGMVWIGHSGGVPGARAVLAFAPDRDAIVAVALTGEGSAEATANLLFEALEGAAR